MIGSFWFQVDREIILSLHGIGLSIVNNMKPVDIVYIGIASSGVIWESRKKGKTRFKQMKITHNMLVERRYQEYLNNKEIGKDDEQYFLESGKIQVKSIIVKSNISGSSPNFSRLTSIKWFCIKRLNANLGVLIILAFGCR